MNDYNMASYDEVKLFSRNLFNLTEDNIQETFNSFVNNPHFQNEYNIKQLDRMLSILINNTLPRDELIVKIITMFIEKYPELTNAINRLIFPKKHICQAYIHNEEEPIIFSRAGYTIRGLTKGDVLKFINNDNIIMVMTINKDFGKNECITKSPTGNIYIPYDAYISIVFNDIKDIHTDICNQLYAYESELIKVLEDDDVETLQKMDALNGFDDVIVKDICMFLDGFLNYKFNTSPIYISMLYGSIK